MFFNVYFFLYNLSCVLFHFIVLPIHVCFCYLKFTFVTNPVFPRQHSSPCFPFFYRLFYTSKLIFLYCILCFLLINQCPCLHPDHYIPNTSTLTLLIHSPSTPLVLRCTSKIITISFFHHHVLTSSLLCYTLTSPSLPSSFTHPVSTSLPYPSPFSLQHSIQFSIQEMCGSGSPRPRDKAVSSRT